MRADFSKARVLVVGDAMVDEWRRGVVRRQSPEWPATPVLSDVKVTRTPGGAANVCRSLLALGCASVGLVSVTGTSCKHDPVTILRRENRTGHFIDLTLGVAGRGTIKTRYVDGDGAHLLREDVDASSPPPHVVERLRESVVGALRHGDVCDAVILSDYGRGVVTDDMARAVIAAADECGVPTVVDSKRPWLGCWLGAWCIKPNAAELENDAPPLFNSPTGFNLASYQGTRCALVTRGPRGLELYERDGNGCAVPAGVDPSEVADVCGAGDVAVATFAAAVASGYPPATAAGLACRAASGSVQRPGSGVADPDDAEMGSPVQYGAGRLGFANGVFDGLHLGHRVLLETAIAECDHVVVALNGDLSARRLKGRGRPVHPWADRARAIRDAYGDLVTVLEFYGSPRELIRLTAPDEIYKGDDYRPEDVDGSELAPVRIVPRLPGYSTTEEVARAVR